MVRICGIKFKTQNNKYFLHLDKTNFSGYYGRLFCKEDNSWVNYRSATVEDLLAILNQLPARDFIEI